MTLQEQRDIVQAAIDKKPLQCRLFEDDRWINCDVTLFDFVTYVYRIEPQPCEYWIVELGHSFLHIFDSESKAINAKCNGCEIIHVLEVTK